MRGDEAIIAEAKSAEFDNGGSAKVAKVSVPWFVGNRGLDVEIPGMGRGEC